MFLKPTHSWHLALFTEVRSLHINGTVLCTEVEAMHVQVVAARGLEGREDEN
jgi:hypothetical protein